MRKLSMSCMIDFLFGLLTNLTKEKTFYTIPSIAFMTTLFKNDCYENCHLFTLSRSIFLRIVCIRFCLAVLKRKAKKQHKENKVWVFFTVFLFHTANVHDEFMKRRRKKLDALVWQFDSSFVFYWFNITQPFYVLYCSTPLLFHRFIFVFFFLLLSCLGSYWLVIEGEHFFRIKNWKKNNSTHKEWKKQCIKHCGVENVECFCIWMCEFFKRERERSFILDE